MQENFQVYCRTVNNVEQFIEVDVTLLADLLDANPKFLIKIGYEYQSPLIDGVPTSDELVKAEKIKSAIQNFCQKNNSWFVGRISQIFKWNIQFRFNRQKNLKCFHKMLVTNLNEHYFKL